MARINFRVTEVNDLSTDGANTKRIVLEAKTGHFDGTGIVPGTDPAPFDKPSPPLTPKTVGLTTARLELVVVDAIALATFPMGTVVTMDFAVVTPPQVENKKSDTKTAAAAHQ